MGQQNNAMTEIALALAMGFFSIMVLALVSMGVGSDPSAPQPISMALAAASPGHKASAPSDVPDTLIVHYRGGFFDEALAPIDAAAIQPKPGGRVVLALDPALPMSQALAIRQQVAAQQLTVATLDDAWLAALARMP